MDNVFIVDFEVIEIDVAAGERIKNPFAILQNLKRIAREHGAHTLRIETTFANEELEAIAQRVFRGRIHAGSPGGRVDIIEILL